MKEEEFSSDIRPPSTLLFFALPVVPFLMFPHLVAAICFVGTLVALLQLRRPRHLHGEAQELEGVVEGALPGT